MSVRYVAVTWNRQKRIYDAVLALGVLGTLGGFTGVTLAVHPFATVEIALIRGLGFTGFALLHLILVIGPLARLDRRFLPLLYNRRHLGVAMALLGLGHAGFAVVQYHALGNVNPLVSVLTANPDLAHLSRFPFELLGVLALVILALLAATSHDYWLSVLTPPVWKRLHLLVYVAYVALVGHVALGVLQDERNPLNAAVLGAGALLIGGLHLAAALRERRRDRAPAPPEGFVDVGPAATIPEGRARIAMVAGERVAVFRHEGRLSCVSNVCKHQNGPLGEGRIVDGCITCPWHGYQYRPETGASPPPFTDQVPTFNLRVEGGRVLVDPRPNPPGTRVEPVAVPDPAPADSGEFYVGYAGTAPPGLARFVRRAVVTVLLLSGGTAVMLALAQRTFEPAVFEYGSPSQLTGVVRTEPYPMVEVERPGAAAGERLSRYLLVAAGKHGAQAAVAGLDRRRVALRGTLAYRGHLTLFEIADVAPMADSAPRAGTPATDLGVFELAGEIVDSKCYTGVMNPGRGTTHRGCAARCLAGGIAPLFVVEREGGERLELLLADPRGAPIPGVERWAGRPLALRGRVARLGDLWLFFADPAEARRLR